MTFELIEGKRGYYDTIWGTITGYKTIIIHDLHQAEEAEIVNAIVGFVTGVEQLKQSV